MFNVRKEKEAEEKGEKEAVLHRRQPDHARRRPAPPPPPPLSPPFPFARSSLVISSPSLPHPLPLDTQRGQEELEDPSYNHAWKWIPRYRVIIASITRTCDELLRRTDVDAPDHVDNDEDDRRWGCVTRVSLWKRPRTGISWWIQWRGESSVTATTLPFIYFAFLRKRYVNSYFLHFWLLQNLGEIFFYVNFNVRRSLGNNADRCCLFLQLLFN